MPEYRLRPMNTRTPGEVAFIARSWVESFGADSELARTFGGSPYGRRWRPAREYYVTWNALVDALLARCHVRVAENDVGLVAGFVVWERAAVHYVYVRQSERRRGVAHLLLGELPPGPHVYTHRVFRHKAPDGWTYSLQPLFGATKEAA